jgi:hypothetical protein
MTWSKAAQETLLIGDFYKGAYGPTILLMLEPGRGARWFHGLLTRLAGEEAGGLDLVAAPETEIDERVDELGGSVIHPGERWSICRDSEGSPFALEQLPGPVRA